MSAVSRRQQTFFQAVKRAKHDPHYGDKRIRKVANSMSDKDINDFASHLAEIKNKKALLSTLKDIREPLYLQEDEEPKEQDPVAKEFAVEGKFEEYTKRFIGQRFTEKEMEAVNTFQEVKPTKIESNSLTYESTDSFKNSTTTVIKKMKEGGNQFVFVAFTKNTKTEKPGQDQQQQQPGGDLNGMGGGGTPFMMERKKPQIYLNWPEPINELAPAPLGDPLADDPLGAALPPEQPNVNVGPPTTTAPMTGTPQTPEQKKKEMGIDDILVTKSVSFTDEIKGGAILAEFLKKLDL